MIDNLRAKSTTLDDIVPHLDPAMGEQLVLWLRAIELSYVDGNPDTYRLEHRIARSLGEKAEILVARAKG